MADRVHLVGCAKTKSTAAGEIPARDRYSSPLFRLALTVAEREATAVYIVSAAHGLITVDAPLAWYDDTLRDRSKRARLAFGHRVADSLVRRHRDPSAEITIWAGADYADPIRSALFYAGRKDVRRPLHGLQIGDRLALLKRLAEARP